MLPVLAFTLAIAARVRAYLDEVGAPAPDAGTFFCTVDALVPLLVVLPEVVSVTTYPLGPSVDGI
jgi:hypothetical protein